MQTYVYRSSRRTGLYVYLRDEDGLERLPAPVLRELGEPELALSFELTPERRLGQESATTVLANLERQGFHVQMPRDIETALAAVAEDTTKGRTASQGRGAVVKPLG